MRIAVPILLVMLLLAANAVLGQGPEELLKQGQEVYDNNCADCHRKNGEGLAVKFPSLKENAFVTGDPKPLLDTVVNGRHGKMGQMPAWKNFLDDAQIAAAVSYIRNAWGNQAPAVKPEDAAAARKK
jgi:cbb3-type cytochrome c oxidase subunit III